MIRGAALLAALLGIPSLAVAQLPEHRPLSSANAASCLVCVAPSGVRRVDRSAKSHSVVQAEFAALTHPSIPQRTLARVFWGTFGAVVGAFVGLKVGGELEDCSGEGPCGFGALGGAVLGAIAGGILGAVLGGYLADDEETSTPAPAA